MKKIIVTILLVTITGMVLAQESHYHKGLRSQQENNKYGTTASDPHFDGGGYYWSRVRNVDDAAITRETSANSVARRENFKRLYQLAYDAYEAGDTIKTILYGDSALQTRYHTADLYYMMAVSLEKLGNYKDADWAYRKALAAGYPAALNIYNDFKERQKQRKAETKHLAKEEKRKKKHL